MCSQFCTCACTQKSRFFGVDAWPGRNQRRIPPYGFSRLATLRLILLLILNCLAFALAASATFCLFSVIIYNFIIRNFLVYMIVAVVAVES